MNKEYVILGNAAVLKCVIPSFVADFVHVTGWSEEITGDNYVQQDNFGTCSLLSLSNNKDAPIFYT